MAIVEFVDDQVTHRSLMNLSKSELADRYLQLLADYERLLPKPDTRSEDQKEYEFWVYHGMLP